MSLNIITVTLNMGKYILSGIEFDYPCMLQESQTLRLK